MKPKVPSMDDKATPSPPGRDSAAYDADTAAGISPGAIFAWRGELVTDETARVVFAVVKRDLYRHRVASVDDFDWKITAVPKKGDDLNLTPGFRTLADGRPQVCIEGEWRPALGPEGSG